MTDWYEKSMRALQLAGKGERTQQAYTRAVRKLVEFFDKSPDLITETELQDYFLHRRNEDKSRALGSDQANPLNLWVKVPENSCYLCLKCHLDGQNRHCKLHMPLSVQICKLPSV